MNICISLFNNKFFLAASLYQFCTPKQQIIRSKNPLLCISIDFKKKKGKHIFTYNTCYLEVHYIFSKNQQMYTVKDLSRHYLMNTKLLHVSINDKRSASLLEP
ncbi:unnamed protein product [Adineta ricciae]|uniref:Uncharacterized protein n=1 Tax=Adineta ricciae TaxID=249248 RepID=A0A815L4A2_ADIRI|nr:unnamed protein product [Adineta ricciae]